MDGKKNWHLWMGQSKQKCASFGFIAIRIFSFCSVYFELLLAYLNIENERNPIHIEARMAAVNECCEHLDGILRNNCCMVCYSEFVLEMCICFL